MCFDFWHKVYFIATPQQQKTNTRKGVQTLFQLLLLAGSYRNFWFNCMSAHTLNRLRPLLIYEMYLQNLKGISSLSLLTISHVLYTETTLAPSVLALQHIQGSLLSTTFFPYLLSITSLVLPKHDWNTEDKKQSSNTFLVFGIYHTPHGFPGITSNQRSPVNSARVLNKNQQICISTTNNWYSTYSLVIREQKKYFDGPLCYKQLSWLLPNTEQALAVIAVCRLAALTFSREGLCTMVSTDWCTKAAKLQWSWALLYFAYALQQV